MSYSGSTISYSDRQETATSAITTPTPPKESTELKLRGVDWDFLRMRNSSSLPASESDDSSRAEMGLKKAVREMLPIIVFKESFSVNETQCSVCLGDYQAEEQLQQIPTCGHTFHMDCIDSWLSSHATCPLCRQSVLVSAPKASRTEEELVVQIENNNTTLDADAGQTFPGNGSLRCENGDHRYEEFCYTDERILIRDGEECNLEIDDGRE